MTLQYLKNPQTNEVIKNESFGSFFDDWIELSESEILAYELQEAKTAKIIQLNINRDAANLTPTSDTKAREVIAQSGESDELGNEFYFLFRVTNTNNPASNPATILNTAIRKGAGNPNYYLRYSGIIIDGDTTRKGYVAITGEIANSLSDHLELRNLANIDYANNIESEINACTTIEELNSINIEF